MAASVRRWFNIVSDKNVFTEIPKMWNRTVNPRGESPETEISHSEVRCGKIQKSIIIQVAPNMERTDVT